MNYQTHSGQEFSRSYPTVMIAADEPDFSANRYEEAGKQSFLVYRRGKYLTIPTEKVAFFHVKYDCTLLVCFDGHDFGVNYSLEQLQQLLPKLQFFRLNRQYLINFQAIKEVEHYFSRKLLVTPVLPVVEKLLVSREKAIRFLRWLENR